MASSKSSNRKLSRGLRLNNPCCLTHGVSQWQGKSADQPDPKFVKFDTLAYGYRAAFKLLNRYHYWYKLQTVHEIMHRFAPTYDNNNTQLYIDIICKFVGVEPHEVLPAPSDDPVLWSKFLTIITKVEQGIGIEEVDQSAIAEGYRMAFGK